MQSFQIYGYKIILILFKVASTLAKNVLSLWESPDHTYVKLFDL